jgi:succinate-semialdehyde dehydrogenase/glutarate-semialdehyde dehydrogenase
MDRLASPLAQLKDPSLLKTDGLINGKWVKGSARFDVLDPATGRKLADVADLGARETKAAVTAANAAWPAWRGLTAKQRHALLMKWFHLLMENQDDLARLMTAEQGKPCPRPRARWRMAPALSSGLPRRPSASTARPCRPSTTTSA